MLNALRGFPVRMEGNNINVTPTFRQEGDMGRYVAFNDPGQPGAGFSSYQDYLDAGNSPVTGIGGILGTKGAALGPNNPVMLPGGGSISQGEYDSLFEGYDFMKGFQDSEFYKNANLMQQDAVNFKFDGKDMMMNSSMAGALSKYLNSIGKGDLYQSNLNINNGALLGTKPENVGILGDLGLYEGGRRPPGFFDNPIKEIVGGPGPDNIANQPANPTPINNTGIGSLTPTPVNQIPESSSITGSITSPYMNNNQDFDQYLNSYINNQINTRMRDIFSGIMNIFR